MSTVPTGRSPPRARHLRQPDHDLLHRDRSDRGNDLLLVVIGTDFAPHSTVRIVLYSEPIHTMTLTVTVAKEADLAVTGEPLFDLARTGAGLILVGLVLAITGRRFRPTRRVAGRAG